MRNICRASTMNEDVSYRVDCLPFQFWGMLSRGGKKKVLPNVGWASFRGAQLREGQAIHRYSLQGVSFSSPSTNEQRFLKSEIEHSNGAQVASKCQILCETVLPSESISEKKNLLQFSRCGQVHPMNAGYTCVDDDTTGVAIVERELFARVLGVSSFGDS